jgi:hypothetical protein
MNARCEKHSGMTANEVAFASDAPLGGCHDCAMAEQLAQHTILQDRNDKHSVECARIALRVRAALLGETLSEETAGHAFAFALRELPPTESPTEEQFALAATIAFLASPAGPTTESMEEWIR